MGPFLEWNLKVLPIAISWFDRARGHAHDDESNNVDAKKLSANSPEMNKKERSACVNMLM